MYTAQLSIVGYSSALYLISVKRGEYQKTLSTSMPIIILQSVQDCRSYMFLAFPLGARSM